MAGSSSRGRGAGTRMAMLLHQNTLSHSKHTFNSLEEKNLSNYSVGHLVTINRACSLTIQPLSNANHLTSAVQGKKKSEVV